jgi:hypothetical protein
MSRGSFPVGPLTSTHHSKFDQSPSCFIQSIAQKEDLNSNVLSAPHPVLTLELDIAAAGLDLPSGTNQRFDLLSRGHEVRQQRRRLFRAQRHRRIGAGQLDEKPGTVGDQGGRGMGEPGLTSPFRSRPEVRGLRPAPAWNHHQGIGDQEPMHRASFMNSPNAAAGSAAWSTARPTTKWVAPSLTASFAVATLAWSALGSERRLMPGTTI